MNVKTQKSRLCDDYQFFTAAPALEVERVCQNEKQQKAKKKNATFNQ